MTSLILSPAEALWLPRAHGQIRPARLRSLGVPRDVQWPRLPAYLAGDRASGDTLQLFTPHAAQPPATNYATFNTRNAHLVLEFDTTTQETVYFFGVMPRNYSDTTGITVYLAWMAATATSGTIGWDVSLERMASAGDDMDSDSFATAQTVTAATVSGTSGVITITSVVITKGANMDSIVAGDPFRIRIRRDVANDTATGDAQLLSVEIKET